MKIKITAGGIFDGKGVEIPIGTEMNLESEPTDLAGRYVVLDGEGRALTVNPAQDPPTGGAPYEARPKDGSAGWFQVYDSAGAAVGKAMREDDANSFNAMSDEDKAAFVSADA